MPKAVDGQKKSVTIAVRIDPQTDAIWEKTAEVLGISKVAVMTQAIRKLARAEGITVTEDDKDSEKSN